MPEAPSATDTAVPEDLGPALAEIGLHPWRNLLGLWNWKAAALSALLRAGVFLAANFHAGGHKALRAMLVEGVFSVFAAGAMGAITQRLRAARPVWATALLMWAGMPAAMVAAELGLHQAIGTPHIRTGLIVSFCFAAVASGFTWFMMQRGALLSGSEHTSMKSDARALPRITLDFLLAGPRALLRSKQP